MKSSVVLVNHSEFPIFLMVYPLVMTFTVCELERSTMLLIGKPSISIRAIFSMAMLITRWSTLQTVLKITTDGTSSDLFTEGMGWSWHRPQVAVKKWRQCDCAGPYQSLNRDVISSNLSNIMCIIFPKLHVMRLKVLNFPWLLYAISSLVYDKWFNGLTPIYMDIGWVLYHFWYHIDWHMYHIYYGT